VSYCRLTENCDVYVWSDGGSISITTAWDKRVTRGGELTQDFVVQGPMQAVNVLLGLRKEGLRVPERAIKQLVKEARR
jgi:hypothetical protein